MRVLVELRLDGPRLAFVRFDGGKTHILQPTADARLTVGRHRVKWKLGEDDPWRDGGTMTFEPGADYRLRVENDRLRLDRK